MRHFEPIATLFRKVAPEAVGANTAPIRGTDDEHQFDHIALAIQVEEAIADDPDLCSAQINAEAFTGVVQLSGFVAAPVHMNKAVCLAGEVRGVKSARNCLQLACW